MNRMYQLQHDSTVTTNSAAYFTVPRKGKIVGVSWAIAIVTAANGVIYLGELSFASVGQQSINDPIGPISGISWTNNLSANGVDSVGIIEHHPMSIDVLPGDRVIYNVDITGNLTAYTRIFVEIDE